ncbi:MAG: cupin domain-containing protein [Gammaproteobacteria bacterium]
MQIRRLVTGTDDRGQAVVSADGAAPVAFTVQAGDAACIVTELWCADAAPPPLAGPDPTLGRREADMNLGPGVVRWRTVEFPPGAGRVPFFHATPTLDLGVVVSGEIDLLLDDGSRTRLNAGDTFVQRATNHAWQNNGTVPCVLMTVVLGCAT